MEFAFYICGLIAILATLRVITHTNPVHALLYLVISLLAIPGCSFRWALILPVRWKLSSTQAPSWCCLCSW
ncbi:NADH dehydrogenase I chain J [Salmonella enterica subsp. enterica]|uniref:NADH dehydrogenase I chain J n=1 Tax=Salmonella enterica I TaxID=59201 RepID=A0A3S4F2F5_SALET|nr:NADH dehydrogenase I chain J [Salmonella enterica subsp. enterica]